MTGTLGRPIRTPYKGLPPKHGRGLRIGLFGGSFNPPHEGHRLASLIALKRLKLDRIWWLVSPGNPLKDTKNLPSLPARLEAAAAIARHPAIDVTGVESRLGLRFTVDVVEALGRRNPGTRFVWLMGADNLIGFHRWHRWSAIARSLPIAVIDRPGSTLQAMNSRAGTYLAPVRLREAQASLLPGRRPPAFAFLHGPRSPLSSTALRRKAAISP